MAKIVVSGDTSGSVTLEAPAVAGTTTLTLPTTSGTIVTTAGATTVQFAAGTVSAPAITTTGDTNTGIFFPAADTIAFTEGGVESMRIDSSGNVGIGTSSPGSILHLSSTLPILTWTDTDDSATSRIYQDNESFVIDVDNASAKASSTLQFRIDGTERMRITSGGFLKVSPSGSYVNATANYHEFRQTTSDTVSVYVSNSSASPYGYYYSSDSDPNNGTNYVFGAYTGATAIYRIFSNGTVAARSDEKWKKNIETTRDGYAEDLSKLRVVKYNWYNHENGTPKELGFIAQEVEQVFPGLVVTDTDDNGEESKSIKVSVFVPMLVKAIQELKAELDEAKAEIQALKGAQ